jgi:hypothetical protein
VNTVKTIWTFPIVRFGDGNEILESQIVLVEDLDLDHETALATQEELLSIGLVAWFKWWKRL